MSDSKNDQNHIDISTRKTHHLEFAKRSQIDSQMVNQLFDYEPLLNGFTKVNEFKNHKVANKNLKAPLWIS